MTDTEIIKALEMCSNIQCKWCPLVKTDYCTQYLIGEAFDLIKRQQVEIEELQILTGLMRKRKYYNKFVKEVFQKEKGSNLVYPDADEIYKRYFEQQAEIERYKDLEEQGRLIELPCKVGDTVWLVRGGRIEETIVEKIVLKDGGLYLKLLCNSFYETTCRSIGKTVFLTKEEAEAKLKEMEGADNDR